MSETGFNLEHEDMIDDDYKIEILWGILGLIADLLKKFTFVAGWDFGKWSDLANVVDKLTRVLPKPKLDNS